MGAYTSHPSPGVFGEEGLENPKRQRPWLTSRHTRAVTHMKPQWLSWYTKDTHELKQKRISALEGERGHKITLLAEELLALIVVGRERVSFL